MRNSQFFEKVCINNDRSLEIIICRSGVLGAKPLEGVGLDMVDIRIVDDFAVSESKRRFSMSRRPPAVCGRPSIKAQPLPLSSIMKRLHQYSEAT
jgi:hypothetical protein